MLSFAKTDLNVGMSFVFGTEFDQNPNPLAIRIGIESVAGTFQNSVLHKTRSFARSITRLTNTAQTHNHRTTNPFTATTVIASQSPPLSSGRSAEQNGRPALRRIQLSLTSSLHQLEQAVQTREQAQPAAGHATESGAPWSALPVSCQGRRVWTIAESAITGSSDRS